MAVIAENKLQCLRFKLRTITCPFLALMSSMEQSSSTIAAPPLGAVDNPFKPRELHLCEDVGGDCREEVTDVDATLDSVDTSTEANCGRRRHSLRNVHVRSGVGKGLEKVKTGGIFITFLFKAM